MPLTVTVATPPAAEPVTLSEAKAQLRWDDSFTADDAYITRLITAARRYCEGLAKRTFVHTAFDLVDDAFPMTTGAFNRQVRQFYGQFTTGQGAVFPGVLATNAGVIVLPRAPVVSVTSIQYLDPSGTLQTLDPSGYVVTAGAPGRVNAAYGSVWPVTQPQIGAVRVRFTAGYSADASGVAENDKQAVLLVVGHLYEHREATERGVLSSVPFGVEALLGVEDNGGGYG